MPDTRIYGYFTDARQAEPEFDPGLCVTCPICGQVLDAVKRQDYFVNGSG